MINIIGGSGFIGTRLCKRLENAGQNFQIIDKSESMTFSEKTAIADVRDLSALSRVIENGVIINLAAEHRDDVTPKALYDEVNVNGAARVCELAEAKGINKIIFTSSVAVYGFAPVGTDETGKINYFNDYGRTKYLAEQVYREWYEKDKENRTLVIIRPTVVFGEQNRGNVYNLLRQIAGSRFMMIGKGTNVKSMAYVENVAAFIEYSLNFGTGIHIYNYIDKPDLDMNTLVNQVYNALGRTEKIGVRMPFSVGYAIGKCFDLAAFLTGKKFTVSSIRIKKFCSNSSFDTRIATSGFKAPIALQEGLNRTVKYEFVDKIEGHTFYSE